MNDISLSIDKSIHKVLEFDFNIKYYRLKKIVELENKKDSWQQNNISNAIVNISILKKDAQKYGITVNDYSKEELRIICYQCFLDDEFGTKKLNYMIDVIIDRKYGYDTYNEIAIFSDLSYIFGEPTNYFFELKKQLYKDFSAMFKNPTKGILPTLIVGGISALAILAFIPTLIGGMTVSGAITTHSLKMLFGGLGMQESIVALPWLAVGIPVLISGVTYTTIQVKDRIKIRNDFKKLTNEDTALILIKCAYALNLLKKSNSPNAKVQFEETLELFSELRTDCFKEAIINKNNGLKAKLNLFNEAEKILEKTLII